MMKLKLLFAAVVAGLELCAAPAFRGIHWQWCFLKPDREFLLATPEMMGTVGYNLIMPEFGPFLYREGGVSREEFREFLRKCRENKLEVVMVFNSLGHGERSPLWPARLEQGFDLGAEENYRYLFQLLDRVREDFAAAGLTMNYLHFGMDEAEKELLANAEKYHISTEELLRKHIMRLHDYCREHRLRMVIWQDMLMGTKDSACRGERTYDYSDRAGAWPCRARLPRDIILMYWNYEPRDFQEPKLLAAEGFEIWLMPWGPENFRQMLAQAARDGFPGVVGSTWMESGYFPGDEPPPLNSLPRNDWVTEAIAAGAGVPVQKLLACYFPPPGEPGVSIVESDSEAGTLLGAEPAGTNLASLTPPLRALSGRQELPVAGINRERQTDELICYTSEYGKGTNCNGFGIEVAVTAGQVSAASSWGTGNTPIPGNGFVLSGHGNASASLAGFKPGDAVKVLDRNGTELTSVVNQGPRAAAWQLEAAAGFVEFIWHATGRPPVDGKVIADVTITFSDGESKNFELMAGRDLLAYDANSMFWGKRPEIQVWRRSDGFSGWRWNNPDPDRGITRIELALRPESDGGIRLRNLSVQAGKLAAK